MKTKIKIRDAAFYAFHGYYEEEQKIGTDFVVNAKVTIQETDFTADMLSGTVDYQTMYSIIKEEMEIPRRLLETVGQSIIERMMANFPAIVKTNISIEKINPSIGGKLRSTVVHLSHRSEKKH